MEKLFSKEKNNSEYYLPAIQSFANNYKKRLKLLNIILSVKTISLEHGRRF